MNKREHILNAANAHTSLTIFYAVIAILEGGCIYGPKADRSAGGIIKACKRAAQQQLKIHDNEIEKARADG